MRRAIAKTGAGPIGAKKLAQHNPFSGISAKKFAQHARKHQFWAIMTPQGELFRARDPAHGDFETDITTARP